MEITINLRISADASLTALLSGLSLPKPVSSKTVKATEVSKEQEEDLVGAPKVTVEELRETAAALMVKNKAGLKAILTKYEAKTVATLTEEQYADALADMKKAMK